jgi:hypothetical protein
MTEYDADAEFDPLHVPKFDALRNSIYHAARRQYYVTLNRFLNFIVIILGASVFGKASKIIHVEEVWLEFSVLVFATLQLTFDFGSTARTHEFLQRKYADMLAEMEIEADTNPAKWNSKLFTIAGEEPMPMRALDALAYNAALDATTSDLEKKKEDRVRVPFCHRFLRHIIAREGYEYRLESEPISLWQRFLSCFKS